MIRPVVLIDHHYRVLVMVKYVKNMHFWLILKLKIQEQSKIHFWRRLLNDLTFQQHMEVIYWPMPDLNHILLYMQGIFGSRENVESRRRERKSFFSNSNLSNMMKPNLK